MSLHLFLIHHPNILTLLRIMRSTAPVDFGEYKAEVFTTDAFYWIIPTKSEVTQQAIRL